MTQGVSEFLKEHNATYPVAQERMSWLITYSSIKCLALMTKNPTEEIIMIRPLSSLDNIGNGAGLAIYKTFKI